jgi:HTH-type transcriptional repressor of NAD biosynthesis genes
MKRGVGMVLGKFYPPHRGHVYLCEFALPMWSACTSWWARSRARPSRAPCATPWCRSWSPGATVHHLTDENPQDPSEHPDFWRIWRESLLRILPEPVDFVFASEPYGERLASELGARFVSVDPARAILPIRATAIRQDPLAAWEDLPRAVRPYFVKRVCLMGPESTGKTTLAASLARDLQTVWVPEYAPHASRAARRPARARGLRAHRSRPSSLRAVARARRQPSADLRQ